MTKEEAQNLNEGEIVFFVEQADWPDLHLYPWFGMVDGVWDDRIHIALLEKREMRVISSEHVPPTPLDEFETEKEWHKLPRGWTYNTELFKIDLVCTEEEERRLKELRIDRKEDIEAGLREGLIVPARQIYHGDIEAEFDHKLWRIKKSYSAWWVHYGEKSKDSRTVGREDVFTEYGMVKKRIEEIEVAKKAEAALTDEEWSIREIEKILKRFPEEQADRYRKFLMAQPDTEDIEVKKVGDILHWHYFRRTPYAPVFEDERAING